MKSKKERILLSSYESEGTSYTVVYNEQLRKGGKAMCIVSLTGDVTTAITKTLW
jgi:hypothetical protein